MSRELGIPVAELMHRMSNREFLTWLAWLKLNQNRPDRHDYYIMRLCQVVVGIVGSDVDLTRFKVKFGRRRKRRGPTTPPDRALKAWFARLRMA